MRSESLCVHVGWKRYRFGLFSELLSSITSHSHHTGPRCPFSTSRSQYSIAEERENIPCIVRVWSFLLPVNREIDLAVQRRQRQPTATTNNDTRHRGGIVSSYTRGVDHCCSCSRSINDSTNNQSKTTTTNNKLQLN